MNSMKSTLAATFLALALSVPALAGNIGTPGRTSAALAPTECGNIGTPGSTALWDVGSLELISPKLVDILIAVLNLS